MRKGTAPGPKLVVSAHLDTVFPEGTDVSVKEKDGMLLAPGIGDDSRGLAALLAVLKAMNENALKTVGSVMFVGTVGEEELGNLRGVKALFRDHKDIDGFISVDGLSINRIVNQSTGSQRYEVVFKGPGGHSFQEFGLPSAIHAMGRAIAKISDVQTVADPKTTFTVGTVRGGTSVNAIAAEARMAIDMRSNNADELAKVEAQVLALIKEAAAEENKRWKSDKISVELNLIGARPAGAIPEDAAIVQASRRAVGAVSQPARVTFAGSSTDFNIAMSLGIPAVTLGGGGEGADALALAEGVVQSHRCPSRPAARPAHRSGPGGRGRREQAAASRPAGAVRCAVSAGKGRQPRKGSLRVRMQTQRLRTIGCGFILLAAVGGAPSLACAQEAQYLAPPGAPTQAFPSAGRPVADIVSSTRSHEKKRDANDEVRADCPSPGHQARHDGR